MEEEAQQTSKYSSGVNIIIRLDQLWKDTHSHSRSGLYSSWNNDLDRIWLELARDLKDSQYEEEEKEFIKFDKELKDVGNFQDYRKAGFEERTKEEIERRSKHYEILMRKQLYLARLENKLGKGTTYDDEDEDDFD